MNNNNLIKKVVISIVLVIILIFGYMEIIPWVNEGFIKKTVYTDMQEKADDAMRGVIGIIPENDKDGLKSHNGIGSGVIYKRDGNKYYAVTAKHVVEDKTSKYKIFTKDTEFKGEQVKADNNTTFEIPDDTYYESLLDANIEYMSTTADLAIVSFEYDGDLKVLEFEDQAINKGNRIMVIGHPEGNRYTVTYGRIKSGVKKMKLKNTQGKMINDRVMKHDAYMKPGNSGGVALSENMKIAGINVAGSFTLLGHYRNGYMIPADEVKMEINRMNLSNSKLVMKNKFKITKTNGCSIEAYITTDKNKTPYVINYCDMTGSADMKYNVGDEVWIKYNEVQETYPLQINHPLELDKVKKN